MHRRARRLRRVRLAAWLAVSFACLTAAPAFALMSYEFTLSIDHRVRTPSRFSAIQPEFGDVRRFQFDLDFGTPLERGRTYSTPDLLEVRYDVRGSLSTDPPTPSGFPAFALNRTRSGEGVISAQEWLDQGSFLSFKIAQDAILEDGVQICDLVPFGKDGRVLEITAQEQGRLDRARYHPPQLLLYPDGSGLLWNAANSSKDTGTVNPATGLEVHVNYGEEYITRLEFDPKIFTIIPPIPEPGTATLLGLGLIGLAGSRSRGARRSPRQSIPSRFDYS